MKWDSLSTTSASTCGKSQRRHTTTATISSNGTNVTHQAGCAATATIRVCSCGASATKYTTRIRAMDMQSRMISRKLYAGSIRTRTDSSPSVQTTWNGTVPSVVRNRLISPDTIMANDCTRTITHVTRHGAFMEAKHLAPCRAAASITSRCQTDCLRIQTSSAPAWETVLQTGAL